MILNKYNMTSKKSVEIFLKSQSEVISKTLENPNIVNQVITKLLHTRKSRKKILTLGNGGSASTASHFLADLLKTAIVKNENRFSGISLVDNIPLLSAWSNDSSYDDVFKEQLDNFVAKNDLVIAFSGSGKSKNVINALKFAKLKGAYCIGFTGKSGGTLSKYCDLCVKVPSNDMLIIESTHIILCHCIISAIRNLGQPLFRYE